MAQIQELKVEMKGVVEQIVAQKSVRNTLKADKAALTAKIKEVKQKMKDTKKSGGDVAILKEELTRLKEQKKGKVVEVSKVKANIIELRNKKVEIRKKIKTIKTKD